MRASSLVRFVFGGLIAATAAASGWTSLVACDSLSQTSPVPDTDASDLDAGAPPPQPEEAQAPPPPPPMDADVPQSGRIRVANLLQGPKAVDLCVRTDPAGPYAPGYITANPTNSAAAKPEGLLFGEVSQSIYLFANSMMDPKTGKTGTSYSFRIVPVGSPCDGDGGITYAQISAQVLNPQSGFTLVASGKINQDGTDAGAGDGYPRGVSLTDTIAPGPNSLQLRVFHGVQDLAAFDVVVNGETLITGIKYGSAAGFPYSAANVASGFTSVPAGVNAGSTLTLRAGTAVRSFTIPERLRRGVAFSIFVGGTADQLLVSLCADRTPTEGSVATCTKLVAAP